MDTIKNLYKIGYGPSSSHTMGPKKAAEIFKNKNYSATNFVVELYGSLAATGKGHLTDYIIKKTLGIEKTQIIFKPEIEYDYHPNGMKLFAYNNDVIIDEWLVFSVGGGEIKELDEQRSNSNFSIYPFTYMKDILEYCDNNNISFSDYVVQSEGKEIYEYGEKILDVMFNTVERGLNRTDILPGELKIKRRAGEFYKKYLDDDSMSTLAFAASMAASEENAGGGEMVTAPTCGASGVLPGALYTYYKRRSLDKKILIEALLVAGLIGNIVKHTGSISGAEVGCQGEVGVACAMASAAITYILGGTNKQIEYAAEIALEHHLGLTCDPVKGLVQIPCIERNAMSCKRSIDCAQFALLTDGNHYIKLDDAIKTMVETGKDLHHKYRETSEGGLAKIK